MRSIHAVPEPPVCYDLLVVTAANPRQARGYEEFLRGRERERGIPGYAAWRVLPDPGGRRVGSGAATLAVLARLRNQWRRLADVRGGGRVLVLHSGGDSRRLPAYAALGKVLVPLPVRDAHDRTMTLLDVVLQDLRHVELGTGGRVVVAAGDLYLGLLYVTPRLDGADVVGLAKPDSLARGSRHGVYIADKDGCVRGFLQKPPPSEARAACAVDRVGRLLVDTGVLSLSPRAVSRLALGGERGGLVRRVASGELPSLDLYEHVVGVLVPGAASRSVGTAPHLRALGTHARGLSFRVVHDAAIAFDHFGTTRELLDGLAEIGDHPRRPVVIDSSQRVVCRASSRVMVDACAGRGRLMLAGDNVVVGIPADVRRSISLPRGIGLAMLPIGRDQWACVVFGDRDDCKSAAGRSGTFLNRPLARLIGLPRRAWRPADSGSLWDARLWLVGDADEVVKDAMRWIAGAPVRTAGPRRSLAELVVRASISRLAEHRALCSRAARVARAPGLIARGATLDLAGVAADVNDATTARDLVRSVRRLSARSMPSLAQARLARLAFHVVRRFPSCVRRGDATQFSRDAVRDAAQTLTRGVPLPDRPPTPGVLMDQVVWVTCPARIDLFGGWTDTPPICIEHGGSVVNAAVKLNDQYPIQVMCRRSARAGLRLSSVDLGRSVMLTSTAHVLSHDDPGDWAALLKAAAVLSGAAPNRTGTGLTGWLRAVGGLDLTVFSALPKGSGLGTSSILGAAVLAAFARALGERLSHDALIRRTTLLEQMMTTGGGWQDQVGGIVPGVKVLTTSPGVEQAVTVEMIPEGGVLGTPGARGRVLLYFTGQRRLARNILQNVVGRYLDSDPATLGVLGQLRRGVARMRDALIRGTLRDVAVALRENWRLKKAIDPGATTSAMEALFARVGDRLDGFGVAGAGGGGFVVLVARSERDADRVRSVLEAHPSGPTARFYDWSLDAKGLHVAVM